MDGSRRTVVVCIDGLAEVGVMTRQLIDRREPDPDWRERGLCREVDPELWFPQKGGSGNEARKICARCEVRSVCLAWAVESDQQFGIWGGVSERQLKALKRQRRAALAGAGG
jgi:WhiB family redox-sensing transcriptional regulator